MTLFLFLTYLWLTRSQVKRRIKIAASVAIYLMFSQVSQVAECLGTGSASILQINFHTTPDSTWNIHLGTHWESLSYLIVV